MQINTNGLAMGDLTSNFSEWEFRVSEDYPLLAAQIVINSYERERLLYVCKFFLQPLRNYVGTITVLSGKRSSTLNSAVGGAIHSDHLWSANAARPDALAVDITCEHFNLAEKWLIERRDMLRHLVIYKDRGFFHVGLAANDNQYGKVTRA